MEGLEDEVKRLRAELDAKLCICILGSTSYFSPDSERFVQRFAKEISKALEGRAAFATGGMAGVQETFAKSCVAGARILNLLPEGESSNYGVGKDVPAGKNLEERRKLLGELGDIYITVEGGPGVAEEAARAFARGAVVLPMVRTGGASAGKFSFPAAALEKPACATDAQWATLQGTDGDADEAAVVASELVRQLVLDRQKNFWELLDELIGIDRGTLTKVLGFVLTTLVVITVALMYSEYAAGRTELALLHGGFLVLVLGLVMSVAFVLNEAARLEDEKKRDETSPGQKKTD